MDWVSGNMFRQLPAIAHVVCVSKRFKGKKLSVDFGTLGKAFMPESPRGPSEKSGQSSMVPSVIVSRFVLFTALRHHEAPLDPVIETLQTRKSPSAVGNSRPSVRIYFHCTRLSPIELDSFS